MILCDTNILIEFYNGKPTVIQTLRHIGPTYVAVGPIGYAEQSEAHRSRTMRLVPQQHPILRTLSCWVEDMLIEGEHWLATEYLEPGFVLQLADDRVGVGMVLDIADRQIGLANDELALDVCQLELGEPYVTTVYNFDVEDFHTYYVGEVGVWVHNTNCTAGGGV